MEISFRLESFEGPLDLLLHLIDKNKMDIYDIQISTITDQYMEYLSRMGKEAETMSEFLVMAATLLDIKARMLLPKEETEEGEEDPREELVQQLLEYKLYKYMSLELKDRQIHASRAMFRPASIPDEVLSYQAPVDLDFFLQGVDLAKLKAVFDDVLKRSRDKRNEEAIRYGKINREPISLSDKLTYVRAYVSSHKKFSFRKLIEEQISRENIIVTFLAVLQLMKDGQVMAVQDGEDDIMMYAPDAAPEMNVE